MALAIAGADEHDLAVLEPLCAAAGDRWRSRLRQGIAPEDCGEALPCAIAFSAAADLAAGRDGVSAFTAGDLSVKLRSGDVSSGSPAALRQAAERLMAPFAAPDDIFLQGVRG